MLCYKGGNAIWAATRAGPNTVARLERIKSTLVATISDLLWRVPQGVTHLIVIVVIWLWWCGHTWLGLRGGGLRAHVTLVSSLCYA